MPGSRGRLSGRRGSRSRRPGPQSPDDIRGRKSSAGLAPAGGGNRETNQNKAWAVPIGFGNRMGRRKIFSANGFQKCTGRTSHDGRPCGFVVSSVPNLQLPDQHAGRVVRLVR
jgi:hypothetical protein